MLESTFINPERLLAIPRGYLNAFGDQLSQYQRHKGGRQNHQDGGNALAALTKNAIGLEVIPRRWLTIFAKAPSMIVIRLIN